MPNPNTVSPQFHIRQGKPLLPVLSGLLALSFLALPSWLGAQAAPAPSAATLAKYDANKNGVLDPAEITAMNADLAKSSSGLTPDAITMNPFEVQEQKDDSFNAQSVGTGGRLVLELKDVPAQYSVINRSFIDALGITDLTEAASWAPGQSFDNDVGLGNSDGQYAQFQQRGLTQVNTPNSTNSSGSSTGVQRNFYQNSFSGNQDSYAVESFDFGQGPNGILFGGAQSTGQFQTSAAAAGLGGVSSTQTKKARLDRASTTISAEIGAFDYRRVTLDYNRPITERIGLRINAVDLDSHGYVNHYENQKRGLSITSTFRISNTSDFSLDLSYDKSNVHAPGPANENYSGWDGRTVGRGLIDSTMMPNTVNNNAASLSKAYGTIVGTTTPVAFGGEPNGVARYNGNSNNYYYDYSTNTIMNMKGMLITRRADATSRTPLWSATAPNGAFFVRGTRPSTISNGVSVQQDVSFGVSNRSHLNLAGLPLDMYDRVLRNSNAKLLGPRENMAWEGPAQEARSRDMQVSYSKRFGNNWAFGLGGDWNRNQVDGKLMDRQVNSVQLDINQLRPDGSPNPHFLEMFSASAGDGIGIQHSITVDQAIRANVQYMKDAGRWGNYVVNLNGNANTRTYDYGLYQLALSSAPDDPALKTLLLDPRAWVTSFPVKMMLYQTYNKGYKEPRTPTQFDFINSQWTGTGTEGDANAFTPTVTKSKATTQWAFNTAGPAPAVYQSFLSQNLALQTTARWFNNKVVFLGGYRRDYNGTIMRQGILAAYYPSIDTINRPGGLAVPTGRWDGTTRYFKPVFQGTPVQYYALKFQPRDAAGNPVGSPRLASTRPTTNLPGGADGGNLNGTFANMDPRYLNDKFRDDYSPPKMESYGSTKTYGVTLNLLPWFAPYINKSDQILPTPLPSATTNIPNVDLYGVPQTDMLSKGTDFGVKFNFQGGKITARYNYFNTTRYNNPASNNVISNINTLINANRWDDIDTASGAGTAINQLGIAPLNSNGDYSTTGNFGYEWELSAQVMRGLRLTVNGGASSRSTDRSNFYPLTKRYIADPDKIAEFKALLEDAGGSLDITQKPISNGKQVANAPGLALLQPLPGRAIGLDTTSAVNAYNNIWIQYDQLATNASRTRNIPTANFFADYTAQTGRLRGLRVGAGVQWQGPSNLGNKANYTILATDPTFGQVAIDDPSVNNTDIIWVSGAMKTQANISYTFRQKNGDSLGLALRINNIAVHPLTYGAVSRQPNGDLTKPNRVTLVAGNPTAINDPLNFRLTATYTFSSESGGGSR